MKNAKVTNQMKDLIEAIPTEYNNIISTVENANVKALFGLFYLLAYTNNKTEIFLSRSQIMKRLGKQINSIQFITIQSELKSLGIEKISETKKGTKYQLNFLTNNNSNQSETMETVNETVIETRSIPTNNNNSPMVAMLAHENELLKEGMKILNKNLKSLLSEIQSLKGENNLMKQGMKTLNNKLNILHNNQNTPKTSGNAPTINGNDSNEHSPISEVETPSESVKMNDSKVEEIVEECIVIETRNNERTVTAGNTPKINDNSKVVELPNETVEMPTESVKTSEDDVDVELMILSIAELLKLKVQRINQNKPYGYIDDEIAHRKNAVASTKEYNTNVIDEIKQRALTKQNSFTKIGNYSNELVEEKNRRMVKGEDYSEIDAELMKIANKQINPSNLNDIDITVDSDYTTKLPKYGDERVTAIYKMGMEDLINERNYRIVNEMPEDDVIETRIAQLKRIDEIKQYQPEPIEEDSVALPF